MTEPPQPQQITLKAGGDRTRVEESEAQAIAQRFQDEIDAAKNGNAAEAVVTTVDLSCRAWPRSSLEHLRPVLSQVAPTVQVLQIDDIIASLPTDEGLESLEFFAQVFASNKNDDNDESTTNTMVLQEVNLNDNALGTRGDQVLLPLFSLPSVTKLYLENCGMSAEVAASLCQSLNQKPLTALKLGRNAMGAAGAEHVQTLLEQYPSTGTTTGTLQVFHYNGSRPFRSGTRCIVQGLAAMAEDVTETGLVELNLYDCTLGDDDDDDNDQSTTETLAAAVLRKSPHLKILNLQDSELGAEGLQTVLQAVADSGAQLTHLHLGGCELGTDGAECLANFCSTERQPQLLGQLLELALDTNELGDEGVATLIPALVQGALQLQHLDLESNELEKEATVCLVQNKLPSLQSLNVADNMDMPAKWGAKLSALYDEVKIDDDLEDGDDDDDGDEDVNELADQLSGAKI
mmetsp:Transcript_17337/g.47329  ORF Transcript_17337/g.47329 Transcript_17337/m.47329 type:complete len:461 (+) Transcript_17337:116-1498(+)